MLNARQHEREAHIVAQAGRKSVVTIATGTWPADGTSISARRWLLEFRVNDELTELPEGPERDAADRLPIKAEIAAEKARRVLAAGRPVRARHRAAREPPHRQPSCEAVRAVQGDPA